MNEAAPITWLIGEINKIVSAGAASTASAIATAVTPLAATAFGIYMIMISINYMRGSETEPVIDFMVRCAGFAVIIGLGLNASNYGNTVVPIVTGIGSDLAAAVSGGSASSGTLDQLALHYFKILDEGYESANSPVFPFNIGPLLLFALKAVCILFGLIPFLVAATLTLIIADVGSIMVAMVGPLFFAFLLFPATRQYFSAWVNTALSYALIPIFVAVVATVSVSLSKQMLSGSGTLDDVSLKAVFLASMGNLILLFLLRTVSTLASSLSAGGINAAMSGSIGTLARSIRSSGAGTSREVGGAVRGGVAVARGVKAVRQAAANRNNSIRKAG